MIFVYRTTNTVTGKFYVGVHLGELDDNYLGSGEYLKKSIAKHGRDSFERTIIQICETMDEAYALEKSIVTPALISSGEVYNLNTGGHGGWHHCIKYGRDNCMSRPEVAAKVGSGIRRAITADERERRAVRMRENRKNGTVVKPAGWTHSADTKHKISVKNLGKKAWNKGKKMPPESTEVCKIKSDSAKKRSLNQDMGALTRGKKFNMKKRTCPNCGIIGSGGNMSRFHFNNCKNVSHHD